MGDEAEREISRLTSIPDSLMFRSGSNRVGQRERGNMAVKRDRPASNTRQAPARNTRQQRTAPAKAKPGPAPRDVTQYADKEPTAYHKAFAKWILNEVGFNPREMNPLKAFVYGVSIATAARPAFNSSDAVEEFREKTGEAKRGPKPGTTRGRKPAPVEEEEDFDDEDEIEEDDEDFDDEFDDDSDEDDDSEDEEDEEEFDDEPEPAPVKRGPGRPRKAAPAPARNSRGAARSGTAKTPAKKAAPTGRGKPKPADDDDDFIF